MNRLYVKVNVQLLGKRIVSLHLDPNQDHSSSSQVAIRPFSDSSLKASNKEYPETHEMGADEKHGSTTSIINIDENCWTVGVARGIYVSRQWVCPMQIKKKLWANITNEQKLE